MKNILLLFSNELRKLNWTSCRRFKNADRLFELKKVTKTKQEFTKTNEILEGKGQ